MGSTGAVWIDGDGDGKRTCARDHARRLLDAAGTNSLQAVRQLAAYDEAVAIQAAEMLEERGVSPQDAAILGAAREAGAHVERGFQTFLEAWRESQTARARQPGS